MAIPVLAFANDNYSSDEQVYYLGSTVNAGLDTGFAKNDPITKDDPHFGWNLGSFYVSGYTEVERGDGNNPTFLKTSGDTVALYFRLDQNIDCLNGNENLLIAEDTDGYDERYGIPKTNFGHGALIIRQTNYENAQSEPQVYVDYLAANASQDANTQVQLFEEGDYEVTLDYEIINNSHIVPLVSWSVLPGYYDYRTSFSFSVRNGNTMVFPFDVVSGEELTNSSVTENGFYIDLAKSRYLTVNVKREVLADSGDGLVEDVRSNAPAENGKEYTEEGVYTIAASNPSTGQTTEKKIYVGTNDILKAYVKTDYSIDEIRNQLDQGATIDMTGNIIWPTAQQATTFVGTSVAATENSAAPQDNSKSPFWPIILIFCFAVVFFIALVRRKKNRINEHAIVSDVQTKDPLSIERGISSTTEYDSSTKENCRNGDEVQVDVEDDRK